MQWASHLSLSPAAESPTLSRPTAIVLQALRRRGHQVNATDWGAVTQAVAVSPEDGSLRGVSDPRKDGAPAGY